MIRWNPKTKKTTLASLAGRLALVLVASLYAFESSIPNRIHYSEDGSHAAVGLVQNIHDHASHSEEHLCDPMKTGVSPIHSHCRETVELGITTFESKAGFEFSPLETNFKYPLNTKPDHSAEWLSYLSHDAVYWLLRHHHATVIQI